MTDTGPAAVVVLAAGEGRRMKSDLAKVLHPICGRSLLGHVLAAVAPLEPQHTIVVVGHARNQVIESLSTITSSVSTAIQFDQRGTGDAVQVALAELADVTEGIVIVVPGDTPLITHETLERVATRHRETSAAATVLTAAVDDPTGYGRVVRDADGHVVAIVEERDADELTRQIAEVNTSIYAFDVADLQDALARITTKNAQGEHYLTDVIGVLVGDGKIVASVAAPNAVETLGVNDRVQLAAARRAMRDRIVEHWMREGVTITDPETTWMGIRVILEPDVTIHQNTQLHGATHIARGSEVGPDCTLRDTIVREGAMVTKSHCTGAEIGPEASVGPYTYLRPGTVLGRGAKAGAFVEMKNAVVGDDSKVPHLSYVGDAEIGERSNIGAATIFVNYDGVEKHKIVIGDDVRIGSDTMLVAPRTIGDGAYTAAGSVITSDVPAGAMGVGRAQQRNVEGWVERRRAGTPAAAAAARARARVGAEDVGEAEENALDTPAGAESTMEQTSPSHHDQGTTE